MSKRQPTNRTAITTAAISSGAAMMTESVMAISPDLLFLVGTWQLVGRAWNSPLTVTARPLSGQTLPGEIQYAPTGVIQARARSAQRTGNGIRGVSQGVLTVDEDVAGSILRLRA